MGCSGGKQSKSKDEPKTAPQKTEPERSTSPKSQPQGDSKTRSVMGKYNMIMTKDAIMGEGTSSICRRGTDKNGQEIAIKVYKEQAKGGKIKDVTLQKFKRQIDVLQELMEPFKKPADSTLWDDTLANVKPERVFMQLLDFSKNAKGEPAPDPTDGVLYVVTELAGYSLKDLLAQRREQNKPLSRDEVQNMSKSILIAMAGLHAKGFVHIDMKPENMMDFGGKLKVIDVDGCVRAGTKVSIQDHSISFSPCYCAPEWARFLIKDNQPNIVASPALDVWSVGMTLCELVTLDAILKPQYANFLRNASSHKEAGFLFMEWLSSIRKAPMPKSVLAFDSQFLELLTAWLLVANKATRKTCAQSLQHPYIKAGKWDHEPSKKKDEPTIRIQRDKQEDESVLAPKHKGTLWKLNTDSKKDDPSQWIKRDMWIAHNHALCYYSPKEDKRLILLDGSQLSMSTVVPTPGCAKPFAFEIRTIIDDDSKENTSIFLATEEESEYNLWTDKLAKTGKMDMIVTMKLGSKMAEEIQAFKLNVSNRRLHLDEDTKDQFEPIFKGNLWKLKTEGDRMKMDDWFEREMWIAKNGSMVYYSPKDSRELVYYTSADVSRATITALPEGDTCRTFSFQVQLPPVNGVEFAPGVFSCASDNLRKQWIAEFGKFI